MASLVRLGHRVLGTRQINQLIRYVPVLEALRDLRGGRLLDVGSGSAGIRSLLPDQWTVVALDADFADFGALVTARQTTARVVGDAAHLPFRDASYNAVIAVDMLEHITPGQRNQVVSELCRVTSQRVVITCPTGRAARDSDQRIKDWLVARGARIPGWIDEHLDNGFPERADLVQEAQRHGTVQADGNEALRAHERIIRAELRVPSAVPLRILARQLSFFIRSTRGRLREAAIDVVRRAGGEDVEPTYRSILHVDVSERSCAAAP